MRLLRIQEAIVASTIALQSIAKGLPVAMKLVLVSVVHLTCDLKMIETLVDELV